MSLAILASLLRTKSEMDSPLGVALIILQCECDIYLCWPGEPLWTTELGMCNCAGVCIHWVAGGRLELDEGEPFKTSALRIQVLSFSWGGVMVIEMGFHETHPKIAIESSLGKSFRQKMPSLLGRERCRASTGILETCLSRQLPHRLFSLLNMQLLCLVIDLASSRFSLAL